MRKIGNSSVVLLGILLIVFGWIIQSNAIVWLVRIVLDIFGWGVVLVGIVLLVYGMVQFFKGSGRSQSDY